MAPGQALAWDMELMACAGVAAFRSNEMQPVRISHIESRQLNLSNTEYELTNLVNASEEEETGETPCWAELTT